MIKRRDTGKTDVINYWKWSTRRLLHEVATQANVTKIVRAMRVLRNRGIDPNTGREMI